MTILRNGVVIRLVEYGNKYARADVHHINGHDLYIFVTGKFFYTPPENDVVHLDVELGHKAIVREIAIKRRADGMAGDTEGVIIVPIDQCETIAPWLPPYPFCMTPQICAGQSYCRRNPACNN